MKIRAHVLFEGLVQGVFFRANAQRCAKGRGVTGWVRNLPDGRVEAVFEGEESSVDETVDWCTNHQPMARVERAIVDRLEPTGEYDDFEIVH